MKHSAGLLLYRIRDQQVEVLLVHPGGPFWKNKDNGSWSIPKGEFKEDEDALTAAKREVKEETGVQCDGPFIELPPVKQKSGKAVLAWATMKDIDCSKIISNQFEIEWPPKSGKLQSFPEVDKAAWFGTVAAKEKIIPAQVKLIEALLDKIAQAE